MILLQKDNVAWDDDYLKEVLKTILKKVKIDRNHDIPFIAGYSTDGNTVYIDRKLPKTYEEKSGRVVNVDPFLIVHEAIEKSLIDQLGLNYIQAHQFALRGEGGALDAFGIDYDQYDKFMNEWAKKIRVMPIENVPDDLDTTPYEYEAKEYPEDAKVWEKMRKVMTLDKIDDHNVFDHLAKTDDGCGPAALEMALNQIGINKGQDEIRKGLNTNGDRGTEIKSIIDYIESLKLCYVTFRNALIEDLKCFFDQGFTIIVRYYMPQYEADHYTVVQNIGAETIDFHDPYVGNNTMSLKDFNQKWGTDKDLGNEPHWFLGIKKKIWIEGMGDI